MNTKHYATLLLAALVMTGWASAVSQPKAGESESILFMKQEEKVARDVYQALYARWGHRAFANIGLSEQRHMNALDALIARYGLNDTTPLETGRFSIPALQALHDDLVERGSRSLAEALAVGVLIEETDIADLEEALKTARDRAVRNVLGNLLEGSRKHLAAFGRAMD